MPTSMTGGKSSSAAWNIFRNVSPQKEREKERKKERKKEKNDSNEYRMDGKLLCVSVLQLL